MRSMAIQRSLQTHFFSSLRNFLICVLFILPSISLADQAQYIYDELGRMIGVIDGQGNIASYEYDQVGNLLSVTSGAVTTPTISSITPDIVDSGTSPTLTITGSGLLVASVTTANPDILISPLTTNTDNTIEVTLTIPHPTAFGPTTVTVTVPGGATSTTLNVQAARTTVIGTVVDTAQNPVNGAVVTTLNNLSSTTGVDGSFTIVDVPTILGDVQVTATAPIDAQQVVGVSLLFPPIPNGVTDVGQITLPPPIGIRALVVNSTDKELSLVNPSTLAVESSVFIGGLSMNDVDVVPNGTMAVVTQFNDRQVVFVDYFTTPPTVAGTLATSFKPSDVVVSCGNPDVALVAGFSDQKVLSVDLTTQQVITELTLPIGVRNIELTPDGTLALASSFSDIRLINVSPTGVLTDSGNTVPTDGVNITVSPNGQLGLVVQSQEFAEVGVLDIVGSTVTFVDSIPLPGDGFSNLGLSSAFLPDGTQAYVYQSALSQLAVLNIDSNGTVTDSGIVIPGVGSSGFFGIDHVAVTGDGSRILVRTNGSVSVVDAASNTVLGGILVAGGGGIAMQGRSCP